MAYAKQEKAMAKMSAYKTAADVVGSAAQAGFFESYDAQQKEFSRISEEVFKDIVSEFVEAPAGQSSQGGTSGGGTQGTTPADTISFGKHKNRKWADLLSSTDESDKSYVTWLKEDTNPKRNFARAQMEAVEGNIKAGN